MKTRNHTNNLLSGILIKLLIMFAAGLIVAAVQTLLIQKGYLSIQSDFLSLGLAVAIVVTGIFGSFIKSENHTSQMLIATGVLLLIVLFVGIVVLESSIGNLLLNLVWGICGVVINISMSLLSNRKQGRRKIKKYNC